MELNSVLRSLLEDRGLTDDSEIDKFLNPNYETDMHDPFLFSRMWEVCERIFKALEGGERVVVHGDYDADGICGSALIVSALKEVCERGGFKAFEEGLVNTYLPSREGDGYGMSMGAVEKFRGDGVGLIITVDCGVANTGEIERAYELDMEVIVIDHHQMPDVLSKKAMIIHPLVPGEEYPFKKLAAVGVAFKVACALYRHAGARGIDMPEGLEKWLLDLVAIATVTDMVPLIGENRVLETYGLKVLSKTKRVGLLALMRAAGLNEGVRTTVDIGFRIGPRINAPGRVASADIALELLLEEDPRRAENLASRLNEINSERQSMTITATKSAMLSIDTYDRGKFIAVVNNDIRIGIAGLIAGKLSKEKDLPAVVMTKVGEHYVGSGRAPDGFHFVEAMDTCRELMLRGGGHPQAAGFTIEPDSIEKWIEAMATAAQGQLNGRVESGAQIPYTMEITLDDISVPLVEAIRKMEPFGVGNEAPVFLSKGVQVIAAQTVGSTSGHLRLTVSTPNRSVLQCIGFGFGSRVEEFTMGTFVDLYYELGINEWNGRRDLQLEIKEIRVI